LIFVSNTPQHIKGLLCPCKNRAHPSALSLSPVSKAGARSRPAAAPPRPMWLQQAVGAGTGGMAARAPELRRHGPARASAGAARGEVGAALGEAGP